MFLRRGRERQPRKSSCFAALPTIPLVVRSRHKFAFYLGHDGERFGIRAPLMTTREPGPWQSLSTLPVLSPLALDM